MISPAAPDSSPLDPASRRSRDAVYWTFLALAAALLPLMIFSSFDFGVTWDEKDRHRNGELIWQFLRGLRSRSAFAETGGHLYPGFFDVICAALETWVPLNRYVVRHMVNATFGWIGVVFCGRLAGRLFGGWAGPLAMMLLASSPRYFADSMNNPKDLPFAAMTTVALFYISAVSPRWPYLSWRAALKIAAALGLALAIRVGALVYVGYFGLLVLAYLVADRCTNLRRLSATAARVLGVVLLMLLVGTVFWPWAGGAPLIRPFLALKGAANFPWNGVILFMGAEYRADALPWYYAPWWFIISTPPVVLAGVALSPFVWSTRAEGWRTGALWFAAIFPVAAAIIMHSTLYDGIRHLEFVYPVLVLLATGGWLGLLARSRPVWLRPAGGAALGLGIASVLIFDVRFHPNQGVYFNAIVGGPRGAFTRYDMDYWGNCMLQAVEWSVGTARASGVTVTVSGNPWHIVQLDAERFHEVAFTYPQQGRHYLQITLARGTILALRQLAREPALHRVRTPDGVVLCTVTPGPAYGELEALRARTGAAQPDPEASSK